jgi:capsular exopolysaccharide synthesis family protein
VTISNMNKKTDRTAEEAPGTVSGTMYPGSRSAGTELATVPSSGSSPAGPHLRDLAISGPATGREHDAPARQPAGGIGLYLHAFRRRWPLALTLGILCSAAAAVAAWFLVKDKYTATSIVKISVTADQLVHFQGDQGSAGSFEIFKGTQQQLLTSDVVLIAALRKPEVAGQPVVKQQDNPVSWLAKNLKVDLPLNTEIMRVSLTDSSPDEAAVLVGAVVDAYMNEVVDADRRRQGGRLIELETLYNEKETDMRKRRTELKLLAEQLGTGDTGALALRQQIILQSYAEARNELSKLRAELQRAKDDLQIKEAWLKAMKTAPEQAAEPDLATAADPKLIQMSEQIEDIDARLETVRKQVKEPLLSKLTAEYKERKKTLENQVEERRKTLGKKMQKTNRVNLDPQMAELKARIDILAAQEKAAAKDLEEQRAKAERIGGGSIDVEMMRSEIQYLEKVLGPIADEREKLKVELRSTPRIIVFQKAEPAGTPDNPKARLQAVAAAGGGGLFGAIFLVLWWDVRKQRINSLGDLSRGLGLTVVGTVPLLPKQSTHKGRDGKRHRKWQTSLEHAVDSIAARLFLRKDSEGVRVVMVSSAIQGEGKTTLAVQLATRLARTGERTLLVDYDLRRPAIHRIFGLPRGPGVSECLLKEIELSQVVQSTDAENLSVITAGTGLPDSLGPLANGVTTAFFEKARAEFTFIVVDGSPILPVIDGLLVSQHADTVVLSVRRDTSEAPQVLRACEKLTAFGSRRHVVVLNGSQEDVLDDYHEQVITARVEAGETPGPAETPPAGIPSVTTE